ncbi:protealysin inhibitor emfourin [Nocardioides houyundeii]|uniref:protealysin inhibitor emfourin n=1 Tax=Nocardioides houyundeii TaxID=2045452 RepID=UPI000C764A05|nr:protealysin inhibitor emfourin [Nocardioides houyundeii]
MRPTCTFVPPYLLERLARTGDPLATCCSETLQADAGFRASRRTAEEALPAGERFGVRGTVLGAGPGDAVPPAWTVHDAESGTRLPGTPVRAAGEPATGDAAVDEAASGIEATLRLFAEAFGRRSYDDQGSAVSLTVHYRENYDNAFWDGRQLVFGDGDGRVFERFTKAVDVLGHEFGHAVTERSARLEYEGPSGALNESVSDVFGTCLLQWLAGEDVQQGSWLIGQGLFRPGIAARALRDLAAPGTAYDDPLLGRDPQVAHLADYVETQDDNGGVHINSGIPNRAFHLAATGLGGRVWERAGLVWYAALTGGGLEPDSDFASFARVCVDAAERVLSAADAQVVAEAWTQVGVTPGRTGTPAPVAAPEPAPAPSGLLRVRRTGGFAGLTTVAELDLDADQEGSDSRIAEARSLLPALEPAQVTDQPPAPDMFVYVFELPGRAAITVPEPQLTPEQGRLAALVLSEGGGAPDRSGGTS